jgi:hypothetical protein
MSSYTETTLGTGSIAPLEVQVPIAPTNQLLSAPERLVFPTHVHHDRDVKGSIEISVPGGRIEGVIVDTPAGRNLDVGQVEVTDAGKGRGPYLVKTLVHEADQRSADSITAVVANAEVLQATIRAVGAHNIINRDAESFDPKPGDPGYGEHLKDRMEDQRGLDIQIDLRNPEVRSRLARRGLL